VATVYLRALHLPCRSPACLPPAYLPAACRFGVTHAHTHTHHDTLTTHASSGRKDATARNTPSTAAAGADGAPHLSTAFAPRHTLQVLEHIAYCCWTNELCACTRATYLNANYDTGLRDSSTLARMLSYVQRILSMLNSRQASLIYRLYRTPVPPGSYAATSCCPSFPEHCVDNCMPVRDPCSQRRFLTDLTSSFARRRIWVHDILCAFLACFNISALRSYVAVGADAIRGRMTGYSPWL